jgi:hypothetical protein
MTAPDRRSFMAAAAASIAAPVGLGAKECPIVQGFFVASSLQKIRLSSDGANLLNGSRKWRADGDGCVEFAPDAGVAHGLRV